MGVLGCSACKRFCIGVLALCATEMVSATMLRQSQKGLPRPKTLMNPEDFHGSESARLAVVHSTTSMPAVVVKFSFDWPALDNFKDLSLNYVVFPILSFFIWITCVTLIAVWYRNTQGYFPRVVSDVGKPVELQKTASRWQVEWYQCCVDPRICIWSFCCPCIRWAHTMDLLDFIDYGPAVAIFFMLQWINYLAGFLFLGIFFTLVLAHYRQKLRKAFGMPKYGTCCGYLEDCLCLCFCTPCILAQEALHVQRVAEYGVVLPALLASERYINVVHHEIDSPALTQLPLKCFASPGMLSSAPSFHDVNSKSSGNSGSNESVLNQDANLRDNADRSSSAEFVREASYIVARTKEAGGWKRQYGHTSRLVQNPTPERLLAPPPVRLGTHGEVRGKISLVQLLGMLHDDLRAYVFLFVEVGCVGHCAASCCSLQDHIWTDRSFWHFYVGSGVNDRLAQPAACPAAHLREAFRRWIFHIDGAWTKDLRDFVESSRQSRFETGQIVMLSYARYIASGLMPYDHRSSVAEFAKIVGELLAEYNPREADARQEAEALTAQIECMGEVFTEAQIKEVVSAFDCSLGRVSSSEEEDSEENLVFPNAELQVVDDAEAT